MPSPSTTKRDVWAGAEIAGRVTVSGPNLRTYGVMTTGRNPRARANPRPSRSGTGIGAANLPYLVMIVVALGVLVPFVALTHPFTPKDEGTPATTTAATTSSTTAVSTTSTTGGTSTTAAVGTTDTTGAALTGAAHGEQIYNATCIACHGSGGVGVPGLALPLTTSTFAASLSDDALVAFLAVGRSASDPLNTTGILMPPRGGNSSLTDADLADVVAYLRSIAS
jgi:mono/diheme cytochrome c family protein